ncbi:MarR family winged helix-turn-helix transcriptional regulator [Streptomyces sp. NPDC014733]|uniref:MarR family winged helix-turn-helix transcriptional regulator n=1 Tax=Streptomyces sp. NPDC014733 TaxID=3364885 RepID=UPI00370233D8
MSDPAPDQDPVVALQRALVMLSYLLTRSQAHERLAERAGVSARRSDLWLLMALEGVGGVSRVGDLADHLMVEPSHVTRQIGRLAAEELVARTPDPLDRRARLVAITQHGRTVLGRLQGARQHTLHQALDGFDPRDVAITAEVLNRLTEHVREREAGEG